MLDFLTKSTPIKTKLFLSRQFERFLKNLISSPGWKFPIEEQRKKKTLVVFLKFFILKGLLQSAITGLTFNLGYLALSFLDAFRINFPDISIGK